MLWSLVLFLLAFRSVYGFKFTIVHNNDMHARYDPMRGKSDKCSKEENAKGLCFGGFARVATAVANARAEGPTLYLNAGDTFHGTLWYQVYKGQLAAHLMNLLEPDAVALGNHEFDDNVTGLLPFVTIAKFPIVCCNLDIQKVPELQIFPNLVRSTVITRLGRDIGIIGYITPLTKYYVPYNQVEYLDEIESINQEARLLTKQGVDIIIALGHSGYEKDRMIALTCPDVDVVIGGHSHTFLYSGTPPDYDRPEGPYPTVITRRNGQKVPVVQAYAFTKYLGRIELEFDDMGKLINFDGAPMLLDKWVSQDANITNILDIKRNNIDLLEKQYSVDLIEFMKYIKSGNTESDEDISLSNVDADIFSVANLIKFVNLANLLGTIVFIFILS